MYSHGRHFCPRTIHPHTIHCGNSGQLGSLEVQLLKAFWNEVSPAVPSAHLGACKACMEGQLPLPATSTLDFFPWTRGSKGKALTPSRGDFVFHWPPPFNQTRAARFKKLILRLTLKSSPVWSEGNRKCETRGLFICGTVKFNHTWHIPTDMDVSHYS